MMIRIRHNAIRTFCRRPAFSKIGNSGAIVMGEHFVAEYRIGNLWCMDEIHLKEAGLQVALFWFVVFEGIQQK
jgi:hypothetical protein